jgi:Predicted membrane protein (DUF2157)
MPSELFDQFFKEGLLSRESLEKVNNQWLQPVVSLRKDLKVLLYAGVLLLSSGLSILVYKNIDSIGHIAILCFIAIVCIFCYAYCFKKASPFSWDEVESPDSLFDYLLVLGGLTMLTFTGYMQYQYRIFGETWNLAAFIPMIILFITAYYFDHAGILSLAITSLAAWLGITINRVKWPFLVNMQENLTIYTAIVLGIFLVGMAWFSHFSRLKPHFKFYYHQFGTHIFYHRSSPFSTLRLITGPGYSSFLQAVPITSSKLISKLPFIIWWSLFYTHILASVLWSQKY